MWAVRIRAMAATSVASAASPRRAFHSLFLPPRAIGFRDKLYYYSPLPFTTPLNLSSASSICQLSHPQAIKSETEFLLKGVGDKGTNEDVKRVLEMAERAVTRHEVLHTGFLTPPVLKESMQALKDLVDIKTVAQGGYPEAERCRLSVGHPEVLTTDPDIVAALSVSGNFGFQSCSHGDFLGAILGTGITRDKLGDIILQGSSLPGRFISKQACLQSGCFLSL